MREIAYHEEMLFPREDVTMEHQVYETRLRLFTEIEPRLKGIPRGKRIVLRVGDHSYPDGRVMISVQACEYWFDRWDIIWGFVVVFLVVMTHFLQR